MIPGSCHQILARSLSHVLLLHILPFAIECLRLERDQCNIMRGQRWASQSNKVRLSGVRHRPGLGFLAVFGYIGCRWASNGGRKLE